MNIIFAGTPEFAVPALHTLLQMGHDLVAVYTQPDRPAGRGRKLRASPVRQIAETHGLRVRQPNTLRDHHEQAVLAQLAPDVMIVVAYGQVLPPEVLAVPPLGCINIHASLLPRWRGAAPIQRAILAGDSDTGVTLMQMDIGLDTGGILAQANAPIRATDTAGELHDRLAKAGAVLLREQLPAFFAGDLQPRPQDESLATYAGKLVKTDACLDWRLPALDLDRRVRAFHPWPVAYTGLAGQPLRIWRARPLERSVSSVPGTVIEANPDGVQVACGEGVLCLLELQLPGSRRVSAGDFINARSLRGVCLQSNYPHPDTS